MKGALLDYIRATVGQAIKSASNIIYTNPPSLTVLPGNGLVTKDMLVGYVPPTTAIPVSHHADIGDPDVYILTGAELTVLNAYDRFPNFVAICINGQVNDILPNYHGGTPGNFLAITVQLHGDGSGNNVDATDIQFS